PRQLRRVRAQQLTDFGLFAEHHLHGPPFVMEPENFLHHMRKRSVTDIMKQSCRASGCAIIFVDAVLFTQSIQYTRHQVKCAQRMCKSRLLAALVGVEAKTELLDAAQP